MVSPAENQNATLLIVDDDHAARERLREIFETAQYRVVTANEAASALRVLKASVCNSVQTRPRVERAPVPALCLPSRCATSLVQPT